MRNLQYQKVQKNYFSENNWSKGRFNGVICDISAYAVNVSFCRSTWIRYQEYLSPLMLWFRISIRARCTTLCDKVCQWLATGRWFSPGPPVYSTNKTDRHDIAEILLKVVLNTINQTNKQTNLCCYPFFLSFYMNQVRCICMLLCHGRCFRIYCSTQYEKKHIKVQMLYKWTSEMVSSLLNIYIAIRYHTAWLIIL